MYSESKFEHSKRVYPSVTSDLPEDVSTRNRLFGHLPIHSSEKAYRDDSKKLLATFKTKILESVIAQNMCWVLISVNTTPA